MPSNSNGLDLELNKRARLLKSLFLPQLVEADRRRQNENREERTHLDRDQ
ncbi:hypothetical protein RDI58_027559 [Solanum bulbocastanum]|uniref:Uncharacterized protein n=1 Tax=Solanum bulbocastanum TaxID=147425 RepID=A0AAN8T2L2_SOLBU